MKVEVIARKRFGVTAPGKRVRLPRAHAKILVQMGLAEYPPEPVARKTLELPKKGTYARRDMVAEPRTVVTKLPDVQPTSTFRFKDYQDKEDDGKA